MSLITEYPIWFLPLCLLLGAAYSYLLYSKDQRFEEERKGLTKMLMAVRFIMVSFLAFLLLGPFIRTIFNETEKPLIIVAQDNSESILNDRDTTYYMSQYAQSVDAMVQALSEDYDVKTYSFGDAIVTGLDFTFDQKQTDIAAMLEELTAVYSNRNVGAVIIASDGNYNRGMNPLYTANLEELNAPIFTIPLGDTSARKDLTLRKVSHNRLAYLGNDFPLEIQVNASQCGGEEVEVKVSKGGKELLKESLLINSNKYSKKIPVVLTADEAGVQHYQVTVTSIDGEINKTNNIKDIYIDVLDGRQKILLLANAPHPDVGAISRAISANENYEVEQYFLDAFMRSDKATQEQLNTYNLIVLHQIPSKRRKIDKITRAMIAAEVPMLFILGAQTDIRELNAMKLGLDISGGQNKYNESQALLNEQFSLFSSDNFEESHFAALPPLVVPFGTYNISKSASVLFKQKIGMVTTEQPLMFFVDKGNTKLGVVVGEGLWRWKLASYESSGDESRFNGLLSKTVQYLSVKDDKSNFKVISKNRFLENEMLRFEAEVYNQSYDLTNQPEVKLVITDEEDQSYPFTFSRAGNAYKLEAGMLPIGTYTYVGTVKVGDKLYQESGEFNISPIQVEAAITRADHQLLYNLASKYDGKMYSPDEVPLLGADLLKNENIASIVYTEERLKELINLKWLFGLVLLLVSLEWFFRKRAGVY